MDTELPKRPLVQIDELVREMTDEEYQFWLTEIASKSGAPETQPAPVEEAQTSTDAG